MQMNKYRVHTGVAEAQRLVGDTRPRLGRERESGNASWRRCHIHQDLKDKLESAGPGMWGEEMGGFWGKDTAVAKAGGCRKGEVESGLCPTPSPLVFYRGTSSLPKKNRPN